MKALSTYLTFNGNCEAAFNFYQSVFGGEMPFFGRFKDTAEMGGEAMPEAVGELIMHVSLQINEHTMLMGCDYVEGFGPAYAVGNNINLSISAGSREEADKYFAALSADGAVIMPMADQFWQSYFGMCADKFGICWMVSYDISGESK